MDRAGRTRHALGACGNRGQGMRLQGPSPPASLGTHRSLLQSPPHSVLTAALAGNTLEIPLGKLHRSQLLGARKTSPWPPAGLPIEFSQLRKQLASPEANSCTGTSHSFMVLWDRGPQLPVGRAGCVAATPYKDSWSHTSDPAPQGFRRPEDLCFNRCWLSHLRNCPKCFPRQISKGLWVG